MNRELSSLNHNEPVFIYRRGGGGGEGEGKGKGDHWNTPELYERDSVNLILSFSGIKTFLSYWAVGDWSVKGNGFQYMVCINLLSSFTYGVVVHYSSQWRKLAVDI